LAKKYISPEIDPSDWDSSNEEESKSNKPSSKTSAAPKLKKSSASSDPFKSQEPIEKLTNKDILNSLHINKIEPKSAPLPATDPINAETAVIGTSYQIEIGNKQIDPGHSLPANDQKISPFPKVSTDSGVQKRLENYFVPQGRTVRSESTTSSAQPSLSFSTEPYEPASKSDLDIITG
jgi:hypothetical protein